jgi:alkylation response protein AidB-like acyl-CoA dehydrogenase
MAGGHGSLHAEVVLTDCRVPASHVIGAPGGGFSVSSDNIFWSY